MKVLRLLYMVKIGYVHQLLVCVICYMLSVICCLLSVVAENDLEFGDKLWPSDDEAAPNDGVCGSEI
jgi:hypothetical protein